MTTNGELTMISIARAMGTTTRRFGLRMHYSLTAFLSLAYMFFIGLVAAHAQVSVTTNRYDNARTGQNIQETILSPGNVNPNQFGLLFVQGVDGNVYGQPLYVPNLTIPGNGTHNVVFVVTEQDSVYAFDADSNAGANANPLWRASMIDSLHGAAQGATIVSSSNYSCGDINPHVGITSTPVIDLSTGTMYVEATSHENGGYIHRLHALDITTGAEKFGGPAVITATVPGTGSGSAGGSVTFDALHQHNRPGLLLLNGRIYIGFASHCDDQPWHGWLFAFDAATLAQKAVYMTTPNGSDGGIWMSGNGLAADASGNIFVTTGNGTFDNVSQLSDSILKFSSNTLAVTDYFTPHNQGALNSNDDDLGSGGVVLLPDQAGPHTHLLVAGPGKDPTGPIYLVDRDQMTVNNQHFCSGCSSDTQIVQEVPHPLADQMWSSPTYWNNTVYLWASNDTLKAFSLNNGVLSASPVATSSDTYVKPGANVSVSSNGATNGVAWSVVPGIFPPTLRAHDATSLSSLYSRDQNQKVCLTDANLPVKFVPPTVVNSKVYVAGSSGLQVYGLLPPTSSCGLLGFTGQFSCDPNGGLAGPCDTGTISVQIQNTTETLRYDGLGFFTGTGYNNGNPGIPQTVAQTVANLFNNDPNSPVTASVLSDGYLFGGFDVQFKSRATGSNVNYPTTITVTSDYGNFQQFGVPPTPIQWTWTFLFSTGGDDPTTLTQVSPLTGSLSGGAAGAQGSVASLSPGNLTFAGQNVGTTSVAQTVTLTNKATATAPLSITSIAASGDFAQTNNCPSSLAVGASCTINVTFTPTAAGTRTGTLTVNDNAAGSPHTVSLSGTGVAPAPAVSLSPASLTFGNQNTGTTSAAQSVTLTNTGTASLSITGISISGDFAQTNTCGSSVGAGARCTISVTFTPTAGGTRTGTLTINDNAAGSPHTVSLTGTGVAPTPATAAITFSGSEKSNPAKAGTATVTIGGPGDQDGGNDGSGGIFWDSGTVFIGVPSGLGGYTVPYGGGSPCCGMFVAQYLVNGINQGNPYVTASCQGGCGTTIILTAKTAGANTNYSLSAGSTYDNTSTCYDANENPITPCFTQPSFTATASGSSLTGGADAVYDTGTITITVNGHGDPCPNYGQGSTTSSIASNCASAINADSAAFVTASASGGVLTLTAKQPGPVGNGYSVSVSISSSNGFSPPSFSASYPSSLSGGH
jgi:hypothetical protein